MEGYWHWLCSNLVADARLLWCLLRSYGTPRGLFEADEKQLIKNIPGHEKKLERLCKSRGNWDFEKEKSVLREKGIRFLSCQHPDFPKRLGEMPDKPGGLFLRGRLPKETAPAVAIVGARTCSAYGKNLAFRFGRELAAQGVQIISGMAKGVDGYGHWGALQAEGETFAVLGGGVDICYPAENQELYGQLMQKGGILSEAPPGTRSLPYLFPLRNRIISGLADVVLIVEAQEKSGSLITADLALEQGKDVYAVPGRVGDSLSAGCLNLIGQGAGLALSPEKLLEDLCFLSPIQKNKEKKAKIPLERSEYLVYSCLGLQAQNLEEICEGTGFSPAEILRILTKLELQGYVKEVYKNYYTRV